MINLTTDRKSPRCDSLECEGDMLVNCLRCKAKKPDWFYDLSTQAMADYDALSSHDRLALGSILFAEGEEAHSVLMSANRTVLLKIGKLLNPNSRTSQRLPSLPNAPYKSRTSVRKASAKIEKPRQKERKASPKPNY
jgi:hypothetical protein